MTLPSFGVPLSLNQIHVEVGGTSGTTVSLNETDVRGLISKGLNASNSISDYYGASSAPPYTQIISGDGFYYHFTMAVNPAAPSQPDPQNTYLWIVVKLGGNIVKGSLTMYDYSTNPPTNLTFGYGGPINYVYNSTNAYSYTHTDGYTYTANSQIAVGNYPTNHFPNTNHSSNLSTYDNFGIQRL